mmetsp:Transcript_41661/g.48089  ORF Transcript_41661/g.48089 Transcript_41661/m.48089 type:complete len:213 (-) Transcript_41661:360-998(-)
MGLVVHDLSLNSRLLALKLSPDDSVSNSDGCKSGQTDASEVEEKHSQEQHVPISQLHALFRCKSDLAIRSHLCVPRKHVLKWHSDVAHPQKSIISRIERVLRADISNMNVLKWDVVFISDRNDKRLKSDMLSVYVSLRLHNCVICSLSKPTWPELNRRYCRRVQHELLSELIVSSSGLQASNVTSVAELGLCVTPYNVKSVRSFQPFFLLRI